MTHTQMIVVGETEIYTGSPLGIILNNALFHTEKEALQAKKNTLRDSFSRDVFRFQLLYMHPNDREGVISILMSKQAIASGLFTEDEIVAIMVGQ